MIVLPGGQFTADLDHYADDAAATLEFRLVDADGDEVTAWSATGIVQVTASGDGPDWRYRVTRSAPSTTGVYTGQWRVAADAPDGEVFSDPDPLVVSVFTVEAPVWAPTPDHVAAILRARTRGVGSLDMTVASEQGVFTTSTRPTYVQVQELIALACGDLAGMMEGRSPCTTALSGSASSAATYRAAMLVEVSYRPEETNGDETAFAALEKLWEGAAKSVAAAVVRLCPLVDGGTDLTGYPIGRIPWRIPTTWAERL